MKNLLILIMLFVGQNVLGQQIQDSPWKKNITEREYIPYQTVREADVFWSKRIWRIIDAREKQNLKFTYPELPLFEILHSAAKNGEIKAYDNSIINGDQFISELTKTQIGDIGVTNDTMMLQELVTGFDVATPIQGELDFSKVKRFKIKEDWFFNSATSTLEVRIIGLAPLLEVFDDDGIYLGDETLYWLYYPELRPILAKYEAYNDGNFAQRLSWDDIFEARRFASYIYQEDNVYDRKIQEYSTREDALYESERIKELIFNFEHDLWSY